MEKEKPVIVANRIECPDGTILHSKHRHDYVTHTDKDGVWSMCDGGTAYLKRGGEFIDRTIYSDAPHEIIRDVVCRGGRGKNNDQPLKWIKLSKMSNSWLEACIEYNEERGLTNSVSSKQYQDELDYRVPLRIYIKD